MPSVGFDPDAGIFDLETQQYGLLVRLQHVCAELDAPLCREFDGIGDKIEQRLLQPRRIAQQRLVRHPVVDSKLQALGLNPVVHHGNDIGQQAGNAQPARDQFELAGLDLRQVEHGIDHLQQMLGGRLQLVQPLFLHRGEAAPAQEMRHAVDGIERRADFVRHVGKEGALGHAGGFGGRCRGGQLAGTLGHQFRQMLAVRQQLRLVVATLGDVCDHRQQAAQTAVFIADISPVDLQLDRFAVGPAIGGVIGFRCGLRGHNVRMVVTQMLRLIGLGHVGPDRTADDFLRRTLLEPGKRRIDKGDAAGGIAFLNTIGQQFKQRPVTRLALGDLCLRPHDIGDILGEHEYAVVAFRIPERPLDRPVMTNFPGDGIAAVLANDFGLAGGHDCQHVLPHEIGQFGRHPEVGIAATDQRLRCRAIQAGHRLIAQQEVSGGILEDQRVRDFVDHRTQQVLAGNQLRRGAPALAVQFAQALPRAGQRAENAVAVFCGQRGILAKIAIAQALNPAMDFSQRPAQGRLQAAINPQQGKQHEQPG